MAQVSVTLPDDLQRHLDARIAGGTFTDPSAYLSALVARDENEYRADIARVQALIDEGLASGIDPRTPEQILDEMIARIPRG